MAEVNLSLTDELTADCNQKAPEATAVTGFYTSTCHEMILIATLNYNNNYTSA